MGDICCIPEMRQSFSIDSFVDMDDYPDHTEFSDVSSPPIQYTELYFTDR